MMMMLMMSVSFENLSMTWCQAQNDNEKPACAKER